jgi:hypothetical protein
MGRLLDLAKKLHICIIIILNTTKMLRIAISIICELGYKCFNCRVIYDDEGFGTDFANLYLSVLLEVCLECILS